MHSFKTNLLSLLANESGVGRQQEHGAYLQDAYFSREGGKCLATQILAAISEVSLKIYPETHSVYIHPALSLILISFLLALVVK